jgi:hypothetical protein
MSTGTKVLLIVAIVFGGLFLLCCGGAIVGVISARNYMENATSEDPQVIRQLTSEIVQIDIPETLKAKLSLDMKIPFTNRRVIAGAVYSDNVSSNLIVGVFGEAMGNENQEQMRQEFEKSLREQGVTTGSDQPGNWQTEHSEKQISIRGQDVTFQFTKRKNPDTDDQRIDVVGSFPGTAGTVMLILSADTKVVSEEQAVKMLESIK